MESEARKGNLRFVHSPFDLTLALIVNTLAPDEGVSALYFLLYHHFLVGGKRGESMDDNKSVRDDGRERSYRLHENVEHASLEESVELEYRCIRRLELVDCVLINPCGKLITIR